MAYVKVKNGIRTKSLRKPLKSLVRISCNLDQFQTRYLPSAVVLMCYLFAIMFTVIYRSMLVTTMIMCIAMMIVVLMISSNV
jgi:ABC-type transport system involved in cytochrome bd biosynthesis fused ATPase/permease subunit